MSERKPTAKQLAQAADIARRFAATRDLTPEEVTHVLNAADMMGMAALANGSDAEGTGARVG